jgi:hypothetical protein
MNMVSRSTIACSISTRQSVAEEGSKDMKQMLSTYQFEACGSAQVPTYLLRTYDALWIGLYLS